MFMFDQIKALIKSVVYPNNKGEITGSGLQGALLRLCDVTNEYK